MLGPSESVSCCSCVSLILVRFTILCCCSLFVSFVIFWYFDCVFDYLRDYPVFCSVFDIVYPFAYSFVHLLSFFTCCHIPL